MYTYVALMDVLYVWMDVCVLMYIYTDSVWMCVYTYVVVMDVLYG